jgi:hypothetical protein
MKPAPTCSEPSLIPIPDPPTFAPCILLFFSPFCELAFRGASLSPSPRPRSSRSHALRYFGFLNVWPGLQFPAVWPLGLGLLCVYQRNPVYVRRFRLQILRFQCLVFHNTDTHLYTLFNSHFTLIINKFSRCATVSYPVKGIWSSSHQRISKRVYLCTHSLYQTLSLSLSQLWVLRISFCYIISTLSYLPRARTSVPRCPPVLLFFIQCI